MPKRKSTSIHQRLSLRLGAIALLTAALGFALGMEDGHRQGDGRIIAAESSPRSKVVHGKTIRAALRDRDRARVIVQLASPPSVRGFADWDDALAVSEYRSAVAGLEERVLRGLALLDAAVLYRYEYQPAFSADVSRQALRHLLKNDAVESVEPVFELEMHTIQGLSLINAESIRFEHGGGDGVAIAICDTGIDYQHPQLGGGGFPNQKVIGGANLVDPGLDPFDSDGHGTRVAGIAAGLPSEDGEFEGGVAPGARLYALKIAESSERGSRSDVLLAAWDWCLGHRLDDPENPLLVVSTSVGSDDVHGLCDGLSPTGTAMATHLLRAGMTVVASSGNDGRNEVISWPACVSGVLSVGAVYDEPLEALRFCIESNTGAGLGDADCARTCEDQAPEPDMVPCYSNMSAELDVLAPSHDAYTTTTGGDFTCCAGGTSVSCSYVAGAAALVQAAARDRAGDFLSPSQLRNRLRRSGTPITDARSGIVTPRIDVEAAVELIHPPNDDCADALPIGDGRLDFSNVGATTDGPDEASSLVVDVIGDVESDVWFCYNAPRSGYAELSLCGSSFDTRVAVYEGCECPDHSAAIAFNDDACARQSKIAFPVVEGEFYLIRIGSVGEEQGEGFMEIRCGDAADLELDKTVDVAAARPGDEVEYRVLVHNDGPMPATGVVIQEQFPRDLDILEATTSRGSFDEVTGLWQVGGLDVDEGGVLSIRAVVREDIQVSSVMNTATIAAVDQIDPDPEDNEDPVPLDIQGVTSDLGLAKVVDNGAPNEGDTVTYTVTLTNNGPDDATGIQVTDLLPTGVTYVSDTPSQGTYVSGTGVWTVGAVVNTASATLTLVATVDAATGGTIITNTASVTALDQTDPTPGNDSASVDIDVQSVDLGLAKVVDDGTPNEGDTVTYTVTLTNNGPDAASGVEVTDLLPSGVTYVSDTPSQGTYVSGTGVWTVGAVANAASATLTLVATVDAATGGTIITNTASVTALDQTDPTPGNDSASVDIDVQSADLGLAKVVDDGTPNEGDSVTYTVTLTNNGPDGASGVEVTDLLPSGVTYVSDTPSQGTYVSGTGVWTVGAVANAASATLTLVATVDAGTGGTIITNTASVTASDQADPVGGNNSAGADIDVQSADVVVTKTVDDATPSEGDTVTYTVTVSNNGPDAASAVEITDLLPGGLTFVSATPSQGSYVSGTGVWTVGNVSLLLSPTLSIVATVDAGTAGATITNTATITGADQADPVAANNSDSVDVDVQGADLGLAKIVDNAAPDEADTVTYTVTLSNAGQLDATGITVTDLLPAGVTYVSDTPSQGTYVSGTGVWTVGSVVNGASATLTLVATVDAGTSGDTITNTATITAADQADPVAANNTASVDIVVAAADLGLAKIVDDATPGEGDTVTYTVTLSNNGPSDATGITVTDLLPTGVTYVSDTPSQGTYVSGTGVWTVGSVLNPGSATLTLVATVDAATAGTTITNTATITASDQGDPVAGNDSASVDIDVVSADLGVTKTVDDANPAEAGTVTYTVTVTNSGPSDATGVEVTDLLPTGVTYVSDTPSQGTYTSGTGVWAVGGLTSSASATLTLVATVDAGTNGSTITNTATITASDQPDGNAANDSDSVDIFVGGADLALAKAVDDGTPSEGDTVTYTITLTNNGLEDATGVEVTDLLPTGVTYVSDTPSQGAYVSGTGVWTVGSVLNGGSATLTLVATVDAGTSGDTITNTATITAVVEADPDAANNTASADIVVASADLGVTKIVDDAIPDEGQSIQYTLTLINNGPADTTGVAVTDLLPSGLTFVSAVPSQGTYNSISGLWDVGPLNDSASVTLVLTATVDAGTAGSTITNTATVTASDLGDPVASNDADSVDIDVRSADLAVGKIIDNAAPNEGDTVTYTVTLTNNGPDDATGIQVTDLVPAGLTYVSDTPSQGTYASGTGIWSVGNVASTVSVTLTLVASVDAGTAGTTITNTANITGVNEGDPISSNNSASVNLTVQSADLGLSKLVNDSTPDESQSITYTLILTNTGPDDATGVQVTDLLPAGVTYVSDTPSQGTYTAGTGVWAVGGLTSGAVATLTISATVDVGTAGSTITNTATVTAADQADANAANNTASVDVTVRSADLALTKTVDDNIVTEGQTIVFTIGLTNEGPDPATGVQVTDLLPAGLTFVSSAPSQGTYASGSGLWDVGSVANLGSATLMITATVDFGTQGQTITNTAAVTAGTPADSDPSDDVASQDVIVPLPLANDDCIDAIAIAEGMTPFTNLGATTDGPDEPGLCDFLGDSQVQADVWFLYSPSCTGTATVSLCGSGYDTKIAVYNGATCPTGASAIACNEDFCSRQSEVSFAVIAGNQYLLRIGGFLGDQGNGLIDIDCSPSNDDCVNAIAVTDGVTPFGNVGATTDGPDEPGLCDANGDSDVQADVWYCYTASCSGNVTVSLCGSSYNTKIAVYDGCACPTGESAIACNDDFCGLESQVTFFATAGNQYLLRVGGFQGDQGIGTMTITCSPIAQNNDCADAIAISEGSYAFDNIGATTDGPDEPGICDFLGDTQVRSDIWYCYTASCTGQATVSLCNSTFDTKLAVYDGCTCPTVASAIGCNEDFCDRQSQVTFSVVIGNQYLIRIGGFGGEQGTGTLDVSCNPVNDACSGALSVTDGTFPFSNVGATTDGPDEPGECDFLGDTQVQSDVWFVYTASCTGEATVSLCGSDYDTKVAIYDGATCPTVESAVACNEDFCGRQSEVSFLVMAGQQYLIRIGGFGGEQGDGSMDISCRPGPLNDRCENATDVGEGTFAFSTIDSTTDGPDEPGSCDFLGYTDIESDIWFRYTPGCTGDVTVSLCGSTYDTKMAVYDGDSCPPASGPLACNDDSCDCPGEEGCSLQSMVTFNATAGQPYLIRVGGYQGEQGNGTMQITCEAIAPNNDCVNAIAVGEGVYPFDNIGATTDGPDEPTLCDAAGDTQVQSDVWFAYTAGCNGTATVSLCGSAFDTKMAVYSGLNCPTSESAFDCNEDFCARQSEVSFSVLAGQQFLIRVGGFAGEQGVGTLTITCDGVPIGQCQGIDGENVLKINGSTGATNGYRVAVDFVGPINLEIEKPAAGGRGKYVVHLNAGVPDSMTIVGLPAGLGNSCFDFLLNRGAAPVSVWNNIGKENLVGASNYFGNSIANPPSAPTVFESLPSGDPTNLPIGSMWTLQGIILNPDGSSPKAASVTNAMIMIVQ